MKFPRIAPRFTNGSSPRVWGTFDRAASRQARRRFIPTCVGNIPTLRNFLTPIAVHPHVCGEHVGCAFALDFRYRFIPTCVGNMQLRLFSSRSDTGSSPRVWGTFSNGRFNVIGWRFIPTCVGNMGSVRANSSALSVHPHVCGEHAQTGAIAGRVRGSSPRVWGTCLERVFDIVDRRFIPTCVGNITRNSPPMTLNTVHPHVCGEHVRLLRGLKPKVGSSPRVWGTSRSDPRRPGAARFIPTCVGNIKFEMLLDCPNERFIPTCVGNI